MHKLRYYIMLIGIFLIYILLTSCIKTSSKKIYTIGIVNFSSNQNETMEGFKEDMTEIGYKEGKNVVYIYEGLSNNKDKLNSAAQSLVKARVDLILCITTPATQAVKEATAGAEIPVVFVPVTDPVGANLVTSLRYPGGNITGVTTNAQEGRRLEWLIQMKLSMKDFYIPYNPKDSSTVLSLKVVREASEILSINLITYDTVTLEQVNAAIKNIPSETHAIFFLPDSLKNTLIDNWVDMAIEFGLPTSGPNRASVEEGYLTKYGIDLAEAAKQKAAHLADQILNGAKPADLPVETAEFFSVINLKTAHAIGLEIPDKILHQTDIIIR